MAQSERTSESHRLNRLAGEKSPYLLQHATNPVDWYPWGDEAFARARETDRPVFLSIGYSTCHWCHVMARESFEDPEVASSLNETFVSVKVDREERPDVDAVYMEVCQALTGAGGWPLTIIMTPDKVPFFAATYLPPRSRNGRIGVVELCARVRELWATERGVLLEAGRQIVESLRQGAPSGGEDVDRGLFDAAFRELSRRFDERHAGFGSAPKFPTPHVLVFLLTYWARTGNVRARSMVERTLEAMRGGGIYDQVGFGFHRYSTDERWLVPHFEKMLYDQASHLIAYSEAWRATNTPLFGDTAREIATYVTRDLANPDGGFAAAEDADSEGQEGRFYLWTAEELRAPLPEEDARLAMEVFGVRPEGNFDPHSRLNVLSLHRPLAAVAAREGLSLAALRARLEEVRSALFRHRQTRVRPHRDDKVLTDWNGFMIAALAQAAVALGEPAFAQAAATAASFVLHALRRPDGRLLHRYRAGEAAIEGFADDYAYLTWGLLALYEATFEERWLSEARALTEVLWSDVAHDEGGLSMTPRHAEALPLRPQRVYDGAMPSATSVTLANLVRLGALTGEERFVDRAHRLARASAPWVRRSPADHAHFLTALQGLLDPPPVVRVVGARSDPRTMGLIHAARRLFIPGLAMVLHPPEAREEAPRGLPAPAAYVCVDGRCLPPIETPQEEVRVLEESRPRRD